MYYTGGTCNCSRTVGIIDILPGRCDETSSCRRDCIEDLANCDVRKCINGNHFSCNWKIDTIGEHIVVMYELLISYDLLCVFLSAIIRTAILITPQHTMKMAGRNARHTCSVSTVDNREREVDDCLSLGK